MMIVLGIDVGKADDGINAAVCSIYDGNGNKIADLCHKCTDAILKSIGFSVFPSALERYRDAKARLAELELERIQGKCTRNDEE
jgi:hypothetical protein